MLSFVCISADKHEISRLLYSTVKDDIEYERGPNIFCRDLKKLGTTKIERGQQEPQETLAKGMNKHNPVSILWPRLWVTFQSGSAWKQMEDIWNKVIVFGMA